MPTVSTLPQNVTDSTGQLGTDPQTEEEVIAIIAAVILVAIITFIISCACRCKTRRAIERAALNPREAQRLQQKYRGCC